MSSYIWDVTNPNTPDFELIPQSQLTCINFNLKDTSLVGAGQYNGQFAYFDVRKGSTPVEVSPIEHSHRYKVGEFCTALCSIALLLWYESVKDIWVLMHTKRMSIQADVHAHVPLLQARYALSLLQHNSAPYQGVCH